MTSNHSHTIIPFLPKMLFLYTFAVLLMPNIALCLTDHMDRWAAACNIVLPSGLYLLLLSLGRNVGKSVFWVFPLIFLAAFQMVLLYLFGRSIIAVDMFLNLVTTNPGEACELLCQMMPAVVFVCVVYLPPLALGGYLWHTRYGLTPCFVRGSRRLGGAVCLAGVLTVCGASSLRRDYSASEDLYPLNVFLNLFMAMERTSATNSYTERTAGFSFGATSMHCPDSMETYVLVVGETARAANFSLYGYGRDTNPRLTGKDGLVAFTDALTESNTTHKSVPMLLSAAHASDYGRLNHEKGIIAAFREAGFTTVFLSCQQPNHAYIDFMGKEADKWKFVNSGKTQTTGHDTALLTELRDILHTRPRKLFVVLHTYGSHFSYRERYQRQAAAFLPDSPAEAVSSNRESLVNAYDNSIRATDAFLSTLIDMIAERDGYAALLYTSDHGENIFDDSRKRFLHASPIPTAYDLWVPLVVWCSKSYRQAFADQWESLCSNRSKPVGTSTSVFFTLLQMGGIESPARTDSLSLASSLFRSRPRYYLTDRNKAVRIDSMKLDRLDIIALKSWHLAYP